MGNLVSIIMPVYNAEKYVAEAIDSVIAQSHQNWELLIINDGSTDSTSEIIQNYKDRRIHFFEQENSGVSVARNVGLAHMKGDYFCFLDGDDCLPVESLSSKLQVFTNNPQVSFVDGAVSSLNETMTEELSRWVPNFKGNPLSDLVQLTGNSFFGVTWMIKREFDVIYRFKDGLTHAEDLWFYIQLCLHEVQYDFTTGVVYLRRVSGGSAMSNLDGLARGYLAVKRLMENQNIDPVLISSYAKKIRSIMVKSYLKRSELMKAFLFVFKV